MKKKKKVPRILKKLSEILVKWVKKKELDEIYISNDFLPEIFKFLTLEEILEKALVNKRWKEVIEENYFWSIILLAHYPDGLMIYLQNFNLKVPKNAKDLYLEFHRKIERLQWGPNDPKWIVVEAVKYYNPMFKHKEKIKKLKRYWEDKDVVMNINEQYFRKMSLTNFIDSKLLDDEDIVMRLLSISGIFISHISSRQAKKFFFTKSVQKTIKDYPFFVDIDDFNNLTLDDIYERADKRLRFLFFKVKDDEDIMVKMINKNVKYFKYAGITIRSNENFFLSLPKYWYEKIPKSWLRIFKCDFQGKCRLEEPNEFLLKFAGENIKKCKTCVIKAMKSAYKNYKFADKDLKDDKEVRKAIWFRKFEDLKLQIK